MHKVFPAFSVILVVCFHPVKAGFDDNWFLLTNEWAGANAYTDPAILTNKANNCANAFSLHNPISSGMEQMILNNNLHLELQMFGSTRVGGLTASQIETERAELARFTPIAAAAGIKTIWNPMPEWDQSGGGWANPRPHYSGLSRQQAHAAFTNHYVRSTNAPLNAYLAQTPVQRGVCMAAGQTVFPCNTAYAYEMGVDMVICERSIDELSDISTGIAFVRGLSRQYDKNWGVDLSTWRTANDGATSFNGSGRLIGGWSPSYCSRHMYISYMGGANLFQIEATVYYNGSSLNPFGLAVSDFGNFSLTRHKDVGRTVVNTALMMDFYNGFDAKHWIWGPAYDGVWYAEIPYSDGDYMTNNFFRIAYAEHWLHGTTPGQNWVQPPGTMNPQPFKDYLAAGGDARPYEPMGKTRYGDNLDIIYNNASAAALSKYRTIALLGGITISDSLRPRLLAWVQAGGTIVVNVKQVTASDATLTGVTLSAGTGTGTQARWMSDNALIAEPSFTYTKVTPTTAVVIATNNGTDPLITSNTIGAGRVFFTAQHYLQSTARDTLLNAGVRLFDTLEAKYAIAQISGPPVEYIVNQGAGKQIVTVVNNSGTTWTGTIELKKPAGTYTVREWRADVANPSSETGGKVVISASVPAYDTRIYAMEYSGTSRAEAAKPGFPGNAEIIPKGNGIEIRIPHSNTAASRLDTYTLDGRKAGTWEISGSCFIKLKGCAGRKDNYADGVYILRLKNREHETRTSMVAGY